MSAGTEITQAYTEVFDAKREIFLQGTDSLEILQWDAAGGYTTLETIPRGWYGERITEHATGGEYLEFRIAEMGVDLVALFRKSISHLKVEQYRYKFEGVEEPKNNSIKVWLVRCAPTGERT